VRYRPLASHIPLATVRPQQRLSAPLPSAPSTARRSARTGFRSGTCNIAHCDPRVLVPSTRPTRVCRKASLRGFEPFSIPRPPPATSVYTDRPTLHKRYVGLLLTLSAVLHRPHGDLGAAGSARQPTSTSAVPCLRQRRWAFTNPLDADRTAAGTDTPASTRSFVPTHPREVLPCSSLTPYTSPIASHSYGGKRGRSRLYHRPSS
jgi:hypothetical protein